MALQEMLVGQIRVANNYRGKNQESMHAIVPFFFEGGSGGAGCPVEKEGLPPNWRFLYAPKMTKSRWKPEYLNTFWLHQTSFCHFGENYTILGGVNSNIVSMFIPKIGEMIQFDLHMFFRWVGSTTN